MYSKVHIYFVFACSVAQSCLALFDPMDCSMPDFPVLHHLPELIKLISIESVMPSNHLIPSWPLLLLSIFPSNRGFSKESTLFISGSQITRASASVTVLVKNIQDWLPLGLTGLISLKSRGLLRVFYNTTVQKHQIFRTKPSLQSNSHFHTWPLEKS